MLTVSNGGLLQIASSALERMAFVFVDELDRPPREILDAAEAHGLIELRGSPGYLMSVSCTSGMIREIAAGMMGLDDATLDWRRYGGSVVSEMANVFGGELVQEVSQQGSTLMIGLPEVCDRARVQPHVDSAIGSGVCCAIGTDFGQMLIAVRRD
ncbi:MAG: chemotaxis protein CheX [Planctomycetota bacterium]